MTSASARPTKRTIRPTPAQPQSMTAGPPVPRPKPYRVMQPDRMEMTEKLMAKLPKPPMRRASTGW
ncbi:hypothetical protein SALBM135S_02555 [Streptomyces alboniger]